MKFDAQGVHLWTRQRGGESYDDARALKVDDVGNAWVAGFTYSSLDGHANAGSYDIFLMKFDAQGVHLWTRQRGGGSWDYARALQVDDVGNAWVAGSTYSSLDGHANAGGADIFLMKFDAQGVHQWTRQRGGKGSDHARALQADGVRLRFRIFSMEQCPADHFTQVDPTGTDAWIAGETASSLDGHSNAGGTDIFLMKFQVTGLKVERRVVGAHRSTEVGTIGSASSGRVQPGNMSSRLRAKSLEEHHLLRAVQYPNFQLDNVNDSINQHQHTINNESINQDNIKDTINVIDEDINQYQQTKIHNEIINQHSISEQQTSTTTASVDVEIWEKQGISNTQSIDLGTNTASTSSEDDSTGLLVAVVVLPLLTACLCASLGICCYRAKLRQLRGAEPQVPNPLAMLPPLAWSVKPLIFSWNSRMTAEWPRGKVQKLSVSETAFELSGRQFQFRPGQVQHFTWEDGTVQTEHCVVEHAASPSCLATLQVGLHSKMPRKVTHFVSWCWAYSLNDVVSAIERWVQKSNEDARNVFLWMCFFCNNQYRIKEEATQTGSDDLKEIFESHLVEAGHMLVLLDTIVQPTYVKRAWCIFESYVCITQEIPMNIILPGAAETFFKETMSAGRISVLTDAVDTLNVRHARAGSEKDEDLIKRIILTTTGFDAVNYAVKSRLLDQLTVLFRGCKLG
ncbi:unnamed protein product [Cladocopium goreaui]|uniref:Regulatory protein FlaEY n=1 Tax=Cladocopium goreaui TaxID=2562237 RepID=A0A9P1BX66_9DINO|nr:unnamed protein product [Cladocopium goreaui]